MSENFLRQENKYKLDKETYNKLINKLSDYIEADIYNNSHIMSVYYDTDDFRLITKSVEKPFFKEKMRIRSYQEPNKEDKVFVELKKKIDGVIYKSRTKINYGSVLENFNVDDFEDKSIGKEIVSLSKRYKGLKPKIFVSCDREYYIGKEDKSLRITFDRNLLYRTDNVCLKNTDKDKTFDDAIVMEIKVYGAMPLWLVRILNKLHIYKSSYSKVGQVFLNELKELESTKSGSLIFA